MRDDTKDDTKDREVSRTKAWYLLAAILCAASMWTYVQIVLIPHQRAEAARLSRPEGNLSDLYPRWYGARVLLREGRDPYSPAVTREIQRGYYGGELEQEPSPSSSAASAATSQSPTGEHWSDHVKDEQAFAYPIYVAFLLAPVVNLPFAEVEAWCRVLWIVLTGLSVVAWRSVLRFPSSKLATLTIAILISSCFAFVQAYKLQQLTVVVLALVSFSMWLLARRWHFASGAVLALATIKPQLVVLLIPVLFVWCCVRWRSRQGFAWGFAIVMAALLIASEIVLPGWLPEWLQALRAYQQYTSGAMPAQLWLGPSLGWAVTAATGVLFLSAAVKHFRSATSDFTHDLYFWIAAALWLPLLSSTGAGAYNQLLLLPMILWLLRQRESTGTFRFGHLASRLCWAALAAPWLLAALLDFLRVLEPWTADRLWYLPLAFTLLSPLWVAALVVLVLRLRPNQVAA